MGSMLSAGLVRLEMHSASTQITKHNVPYGITVSELNRPVPQSASQPKKPELLQSRVSSSAVGPISLGRAKD